MGFYDLRDFMAAAERHGMLRVIEGAHWDLELGAVATMLHDTPENPIVLFDRITGYPPGYRVLTNHQSSIRKLALIEGVAPDLPPMEILRALKERRKEIYPIPPRQVADGPVFENCDRGDEVNLLKFPVPRWRALDAGRYIGTGTAVINRDPEGDWVNVGTYRQQVHDERTVGMYIEHAHHGRIIAAKYWADGKACPVVVCYGQEVELFRASAGSSPWGRSELDVAGGLKGEPIDVVKGPLTGLPIPARAEIAVEGEIPPPSVEARTEGPFREWPGYYTQAAVPQPVLHVRAVYHRNDPIMTGPLGNDRNVLVDGTHHAAIAVWEALERTALPGVQGVWDHCNGLFIVISIQQQFAGHAKMALLTATSARGSGSAYRYYVVVDDDIDPTNLTDVLWAMTTRCVPENQIDIVRGALAGQIDPVLSPAKRESGDFTCGRVLIDACKPWEWKDRFAKSMTYEPGYWQEMREKWAPIVQGG